MNLRLLLALLVLGCLGLSNHASAQYTETVLYSFTNGSDGGHPTGGLIQATDGNFYGLTPQGGANGSGTIYQLTSSGTFTVLHGFGYSSTTPNDGAEPMGSLVQASDGYLYGATLVGYGSASWGSLFKISLGDTSGTSYAVATDFPGPSSPVETHAGLIQGNDGNLYGTFAVGGPYNGGAVFSFNRSSGVTTFIHIFSGGADGFVPFAPLIKDASGNLYGTTMNGGSTDNDGTVFKMTPSGTTTVPDTVLHNFGDPSVTNDGENPQQSVVIGSDGNLYGLTTSGGIRGQGIAFEITLSGTETYTILHTFGDGSVTNDGIQPFGSLILASDGNFYGTTGGGGANNQGTVFRMTPAGIVTIIHSFGDPTVAHDGSDPRASLVQGADGNLYGTTAAGGSASFGTIFRITLPPPVAQDTPAMPPWALGGLMALLLLAATLMLRKRPSSG